MASGDYQSRGELEGKRRTAVVIGVAMVAAVFCYAFIVELIRTTQAPFEGFVRFAGWENLRYVFFAIVLADLIVLKFIRRVILAPKRNRPTAPPVEQRLMTVATLTYSISLLPALLGFVLFVISGSVWDFYLFSAISLVLFAIYFPRSSTWEQWNREARSS